MAPLDHILTRTAAQLAEALSAGDVSSREITQASLEHIDATDERVHAFLHVNGAAALEAADEADRARAAGEQLPELAGVPVAVKDIIVTRDQPTTAGSKILEGWRSPYDATVVRKLRAARMPLLGKTNLDEFAMGSSTEHSAYGPTCNPWDLERVPGGSGGGSAAAVAAAQAPLALGTDTGGSIRQPGALTGTVGVKPTYGGISRYGAIAMASSLDQIGPVTRSVLDAALLHEVIGGHDPRDSTSLPQSCEGLARAAREGARAQLAGRRIGVIRELGPAGYQSGIYACFERSLQLLREAGAQIVEIACPNFTYALGAYYLIMSSEASSNLAKFDGVRFGLRVLPRDGPVTVERMMAATRAAGFGSEVKRRIILGTYALSAGHYDAYYGSAQKVRTLIQGDFAKAFEQVEVLVSPTAPTTAFPLGAKVEDPMAMYVNDIATIPANLAGIPAASVPNGLAREDGLPSGVQVLAPAYADARVYEFAAALEALHESEWGAPLLAQAPPIDSGRMEESR